MGGAGYRGRVSTADLERDASEHDPDAAVATADALEGIEAAPLEERAAGYDALAERLRAELERSDPARAAG